MDDTIDVCHGEKINSVDGYRVESASRMGCFKFLLAPGEFGFVAAVEYDCETPLRQLTAQSTPDPVAGTCYKRSAGFSVDALAQVLGKAGAVEVVDQRKRHRDRHLRSAGPGNE
jgi:hypothetical protein